jgi:hypothetical protein
MVREKMIKTTERKDKKIKNELGRKLKNLLIFFIP